MFPQQVRIPSLLIGRETVVYSHDGEKKASPPERAHCNKCGSKTRHDILKTLVERDKEWVEEMDDYLAWTAKFDVMQCLGCREVILRKVAEWNQPWMETDISYFPPSTSRSLPTWRFGSKVPRHFKRLLLELYRSLDADNYSLPLMGARALLDMVLVDKVGDIGGFSQKLKELEKAGYISSKSREVLEAALDAGSAAAHRGHEPSVIEVHLVMDIVENLVQSVYVLEHAAQTLKATTPPRPPKKP